MFWQKYVALDCSLLPMKSIRDLVACGVLYRAFGDGNGGGVVFRVDELFFVR